MDTTHIENFHRVLDATIAEGRRMIERKRAEILQLEDLINQIAYTRSINPPKPLAQVLPIVAPIFQDTPAASPAAEDDPIGEAVARAVDPTGTLIVGPGPEAQIASDLDDEEDPTRRIARRFAPAAQ